LKIAVNTRFLLKGALEGIGWYTHELFRRIVANHPEHEFYFMFDRAYDKSFVYAENVTPVRCFPPARHPFLWYYWFEKSLPKKFKEIKPDLFVSLDGYLSLSTDVPTLTVIHDLAFEHYPKDLCWSHRTYYRHYTPKFARRADKIVTVSEFSKQDIHDKYKTPLDKIEVVTNGVKEMFIPLDVDEKIEVRKTYADGHHYLVYVGALHPRKNISRLLQAFDNVLSISDEPLKLLIVGRKAWSTTEMEEVYNNMKHKADVVFTDRLSSDDVAKVIGAAEALCYVPYFEGFGVPIIEAQKAGVPVVCSNVSSMPEAAGGQAVLVDPMDVRSIQDGILKVLLNRDRRQQMILGGLENVKKYDWDKSAERMWDLMMETV